jgi:UDP-4-amino-4,6-dideoxy-N-acetyl-beta-L-altrosamine N-acetyltransferase
MDDVLLTKLTAEDIELVRKWRNSKDVASYMYNEDYITKENQINWFNNIDWNKSFYWIISYKGKKLGLASINSIDRTLQSCYWAFYLGDSSVRGGGIGAKVEYTVLNYVFLN